MSWLGSLLAAPVRVLNVPFRAVEHLAGAEDEPIASVPLESVAKAIEEAV